MTTLPIADPATGLRRGPIRHPDGRPPLPSGCRWCGVEPGKHYGGAWVPRKGWHQWVRPTSAQILARMRARRAAHEEARRLDAVETAFSRAAGLVGPAERRRRDRPARHQLPQVPGHPRGLST
jgi:hypothetical protein